MKSYIGQRFENGCRVQIVDDVDEADVCDLPLHLEIHNHSPTGFEWGYGGSGPAQLALAILADVAGPEKRVAGWLYQTFKWEFVAKWTSASWRITEDEVRAWVHQQSEAMEVKKRLAFEEAQDQENAAYEERQHEEGA